MKVKEYTLREKKHAKTKLAIMQALMQRLKHNRFDNISIRELCQDTEIAEGTFFNYFPEKIDVVNYYICLTTLKMIWVSQKEATPGKYLSLIEALFSHVSDYHFNNNVSFQILSVLLSRLQKPKNIIISSLEKKLAYPDCPGIEDIPVMLLDDWMKQYIHLAIKNNELPLNTNINDLIISLMTIVSGTSLAMQLEKDRSNNYHYLRQLKAVWLTFGAKNSNKNK
ncbi:MAG: TetR/AcrR family transcriptional regulator [bacterium]